MTKRRQIARWLIALLAIPLCALSSRAADFHHIRFYVSDPKAAAEWYAKHLEGRAERFGETDTAVFGPVRIVFLQVKEGAAPGESSPVVDHVAWAFKDALLASTHYGHYGASQESAADKKSQKGQAKKVEFDCKDSHACPAIKVIGEPSSNLPEGSPSVFRGTVDASILTDPATGALFLSYTYTFVSSHVAPPSPGSQPGSQVDPSVSVFLASSKDSGKTWTFEKALRPGTPENDPVTGKPGYAGYEVSSIATGAGQWYLAYLRFHDPVGNRNNRRPDSFHLEVVRAPSPAALASARAVKLAGTLAADAWSDYRLAAVAPECAGCSLWLDPVLFYQAGHLYLMAVCVPFESGQRLSEKSFYAVFELSQKPDDFGKPRYLGKLGVETDAARFGAKELSKGDLVKARDGTLLFITSPVFRGPSRFEEYPGCFVFEVESLNPPRLRRGSDGSPFVRAVFRSSDSEPTSASGAYDPDSKTGLILTRRLMRPGQRQFIWSLHATGIHP